MKFEWNKLIFFLKEYHSYEKLGYRGLLEKYFYSRLKENIKIMKV